MNDRSIIPIERIESHIYLMRGKKVMLDRDLAALYGVTTGALNQAVRRNSARFPTDFCFQMTEKESQNLISQFVISSLKHGGLRKIPFVFTEQGVAMLSSVLKSERAIQVNIQIIRTFCRLREVLIGHEELRLKLEALEKTYDEQFKIVFDALRGLLKEPAETTEIGFKEKS